LTFAQSPAEIQSIAETFRHGINRIAISEDGQRVAISDVDMNVSVYDGPEEVFSENFSSINEKIKPTERIRGMAFSPNADLIYVAAGDIVQAIRIASREVQWSYVAPRSFGFLIISPISLDVSDDGDVVAAFDNGSIAVWDSSGIMKSLWHDNDSPRMVRFVPGGERVVGTDSFSLCMWDVKKRKRKLKLGLSGRVYGMDVHRCGTIVATRTLQDVVLWDLVLKDILGVIPVDPGTPILALHPFEKWVACGEKDHIKITDFDGNVILRHSLHVASALCMAFDPSGSELYVGCTHHQLIRIPMNAPEESWSPI